MTFRFEYMTQTQIGKLFGVTAQKVGKWLVDLGLRNEDGKPTEEAHRGHFCRTAPSGQTGYHWVWHSAKTVAALRDAGHPALPNPPQCLVQPAILNGPFSVRKTTPSDFAVENSDGSTSVWANNRMTADVVVKILNLAYRHGVIDRLCAPQRLLQMPLAPDSEIDNVVHPFEKPNEEPPSQESAPRQSSNVHI